MPQGFVASGNAFTFTFFEIISNDVAHKVRSENKFQFYVDTAFFAGIKIMPTDIELSESILASIRDFPKPKEITTDSRLAWLTK